ncbi:MAG: PcfJ domain-containing protein, partial [Bacteroidales bacterium]
MKPKTKFQREVVELSKTLPSITTEQKKWACKNLFTHVGRRLKSGKITCMECGTSWQGNRRVIESNCNCPNCHTNLTIQDTRKCKFKEVEYLSIITKHNGDQVLRFFYVEQSCKAGAAAHYFLTEVVQRWIAPSGKYATLAM